MKKVLIIFFLVSGIWASSFSQGIQFYRKWRFLAERIDSGKRG